MIPFSKPLRRALLGLATIGLASLAACDSSDVPVGPVPDEGPTVNFDGVQLVKVPPSQSDLPPKTGR